MHLRLNLFCFIFLSTEKSIYPESSKIMDDITPEEKKVVDELKRRTINDVTPKMLEDVSIFYRFSKARDFNLVEAEAMLRKHIAWRQELGIDTILTDYTPPEVLVKYAPTTFLGFDKEGSIVRLLDCGRTDIKGLWNTVSKAEFAKYAFYVMERDKDMLIKKGRNLDKLMYTPIHDYDNLSYSNAVNLKTVQYLGYMMRMFVDNYPETIKRISIINAPYYCALIFSAIRRAIPKQVNQKIRIYAKDGWKEDLLEIIDAECLPAYLGGTRTDPDGNPLCTTFIHRGCPIPKSYYMNKSNKKLSLTSGAEKLTVKPSSKEEVCFEVKEENSHLELELKLTERDIDFSLHFNERSSEYFESIEIVPKQRIDASSEPEKMSFKCEKPGIYTVAFDNSYSWFHSKELLYKAEIKSSKDDEIYR